MLSTGVVPTEPVTFFLCIVLSVQLGRVDSRPWEQFSHDAPVWTNTIAVRQDSTIKGAEHTGRVAASQDILLSL